MQNIILTNSEQNYYLYLILLTYSYKMKEHPQKPKGRPRCRIKLNFQKLIASIQNINYDNLAGIGKKK